MKISWKPAPGETGSTIVLATPSPERGPGSRVVTTKERSFSPQFQVVQYPGATEIETFDRQNLSTSYAVTVHATFNSITECEQYCDDIGTRLHGRGILELTYTGGGQRSLLCSWAGASARSTGVSAVIQYQFLGGAFTKGPATNQVPALV